MIKSVKVRTGVLALILFTLGIGNVFAADKVVVIPLGGDLPKQGYCPPVKQTTAIGGPAALHNFCWYLSAARTTCDTVCGDVGGTNLAAQAEDEWSDDACYADADKGPSEADVSTWFFNHGNPAGWGVAFSAGSVFHTLGYGWPGGGYYGKCSTGTNTNSGVYPGEANTTYDLNVVCPCFGFGAS